MTNDDIDLLRTGASIDLLEQNDDGSFLLGTNYPVIVAVSFTADAVKVDWDRLLCRAWYERECHLEMEVHVKVDGRIEPARIVIDEAGGLDAQVDSVQATLTHRGNTYQGFGTNFTWDDAVADIQSQLPATMAIACCLTCKHGNMCPLGNNGNELYCMKDVRPQQPDDLLSYMRNEHECDKRSRPTFGFCDDFQEQNDDYYTYNDYLPKLQKKLARRGVKG